MRKILWSVAILFFVLGTASLLADESRYTNESFARLTYVTGKIFLQRAADLGYEEAVINTPIQEGDRVGTTDGRAEIYLGHNNFLRLDNNTKVDFMDLPKRDNDVIRIRVWTGNIYFGVSYLKKEKSIELHSPDASFYVLDKGLYRLDVRENEETEILVFRGLVEAAGEEGSTLVKSEQHLQVSQGRFADRPAQFMATAEDAFDQFNDSRDSEFSRTLANRYLPDELEDFESELDANGEWTYLRPYGYVWSPSGVDAGWRPYYNGRWDWLPLSGWTWLPYEPWGWAPFHYGRWGWTTGIGWYWIPQAYWGPAWVNWWWDGDYYGWAPLSYWGYPVVIVDNFYYDRWDGHGYPFNSRALTVIRKDQLRGRNIAQAALHPEELRNLGKINLSNPSLTQRPEIGGVRVEPLGDKRYILRKEGQGAESGKGQAKGTEKVAPKKPSGNAPPASTNPPKERKIRKKKEPSASASIERGPIRSLGKDSSGLSRRNSVGYSPSPEIDLKKYGAPGEGERSGSFINRIYNYITGGSSSYRSPSNRGTSGSGSISSRSGSKGSSSGSYRGSSSGRSSSSGSRTSGSVRKK